MAKGRKLALFAFIDALGFEILRQHAFLDDILTSKEPNGTIFGYSSTCDPTIITGLLPRDHGHFSFYCYDPSASPFKLCRWLSILPKSIMNRGRVRNQVSKLFKRLLGYTGYFQLYNMPFDLLPLFDYSEKRDLYQPGGINSGARTIFDDLRDNKVPFYLSDWRASEEVNLKALRDDLADGDITFAYLYMAAMDAILHADGTKSPRVDKKIEWYEQEIRRVLDVADKRYDTVHLYVFSDHGMTDCDEDCALMPQIEALDLKFGLDYAAVYDSTMARFWFLKDGVREPIAAALGKEPRGSIISQETLHEYGCDFPDKRYGDLFYVMNPGVLLCPSHMGEKHLAGMHGFEPYHKDSIASFSSNISPDPQPKRLDDIYGLMKKEAFG